MRTFVLDRLYPRALDGLPGLGTPQAFAGGYRDDDGTLRERAERLVIRHIAASSAAGFLSGLGGILTLPVVLPANIAAVALVQLHMAASVAALAGENPADRAVRERVLRCLVGEAPPRAPRTAEEETLDRVGLKLAERGLNLLVTAAVGAATWAGRQAATTIVKRRLLRGIPLVGGALGALSDGYVTASVAGATIAEFIPQDEGDGGDASAFPSGDGMPKNIADLPRLSPT